MNKVLTYFICQLLSLSVLSQNIDYARKVIDTLTSSGLKGRGAVDNGEKKAANFIRNEYKRFNLKPLGDSFFQQFTYPINTFPGQLDVQLDDKKLIPGVDYLVGAKSCKAKGTFQLVWYSENNVPSKKQLKKLVAINFFTNKFIVINDEGSDKNKELFNLLKLNVYGASGIILIEDQKLTHGLSTTHEDFVTLIIKRESIFQEAKTISIDLDQRFDRKYESQNVIGYLQGTQFPDSFVFLTAHYDHIGTMGNDVFFPGANDNASGVAMLLNLLEYYSKNAPKKSIVFIAFGGEEAGLIGSKFFVENPPLELDKINFVMNMDLMGTGEDGAAIVNATVFTSKFELFNNINNRNNYLSKIKQRGRAQNSDHFWFSEKGIPSFFMYTLGGITAYHDIDDIAETLPLTEFKDCFLLIRDFISEL